MIPGLGSQGWGFLWAALAGVCLGLCYDFGRGLRRVWPGLTVPVDAVFSLGYLLVLLGLMLYTEGLRIYQVLGIFGAAALYHLTLGGPILRFWLRCFSRLRRLGGRIARGCKKSVIFLRKLQKKLFSTSQKWGTIKAIPFLPKAKGTPQRSADRTCEKRRKKAAGRHSGRSCRMEPRQSGPGAGQTRKAKCAFRAGRSRSAARKP